MSNGKQGNKCEFNLSFPRFSTPLNKQTGNILTSLSVYLGKHN